MERLMNKVCSRCKTEKPVAQFALAPRAGVGKKNPKRLYGSYCKACKAELTAEWRAANPGSKNSGRISSTPLEDRALMSEIRRILRVISRKGQSKPTVTDTYLYELFLKQERCCVLSDAPLSLESENDFSLSLSLIDPLLGYEEGNVIWLARCVSKAKGDLSLDHFHEICGRVVEIKAKRASLQKVSSD
jgi:hypothetical protein